jgi:hypothetical protein
MAAHDFISLCVCPFFLSTEVNLLEELSLQVSNSSNASMSLDALRCPVLQVGQYSTLSLPLAQLFTDG